MTQATTFVATLLSLLLALRSSSAFSPTTVTARTATTRLYYKDKDATPLVLSDQDRRRLQQPVALPLLILEPLVPGQTKTFGTSDPVIARLVQYCIDNKQKLAVLGVHNNEPLNHGVVCDVQLLQAGGGVELTAGSRFRVEGDGAWPHRELQFYMTKCSVLEEEIDLLSDQEMTHARQLATQLPELLRNWKKKMDEADLDYDESELVDEDASWTDLSFQTARLLNPSKLATQETTDIRPAMLSVTTPLQRLLLAATALQSGMDHLTAGKKKQ